MKFIEFGVYYINLEEVRFFSYTMVREKDGESVMVATALLKNGQDLVAKIRNINNFEKILGIKE